MFQIARAHHGLSEDEHSRRGKFTSLKSISGSDDGLDRSAASEVANGNSGSSQQRTNSSVHVCWHRSATVGGKEQHAAMQTLLSG